MGEPFHVCIKLRASISTGKSTVHLSNISESLAADPSQRSQPTQPSSQPSGQPSSQPSGQTSGQPSLADVFVHPYDFFVGAWMGDQNPHMQFEMLRGQKDGTGVASLKVPVLPGDTDTLKLGVFIRDPNTKMMRHLASGFQGLDTLAADVNGVSAFEQAQSSLLLKDNYSRNQVLFHFVNDGTDLPALRRLCATLRPSVLRENEAINQVVMEMTSGVHGLIEKASNVSNSNGGPNFVNSQCFTQAMGCAINYPLLDLTYSSERHATPLGPLSYMALATLHYTGLTAEEALRLDDHDFTHRFVVPLCTSFTVCPKTAVYSGDKTLDAKGNLDQSTEDFSMVLCSHFYTDVKDAYADRFKGTLAEMSDTQLAEHVKALAASPCANSKGHIWIADDCETLSGCGKSIASGVHLEARRAGFDHAQLGAKMWACTRGQSNLSAVPRADFVDCARLLCRYGRLRENCEQGKAPFSQLGLGIVSAKGASFSTGNCDLNGHCCTIAQTVDAAGTASYSIGEGTCNLLARNLPDACPRKVSIVLSTGAKLFSTTEALGVVAQNMSEMLGTKGQTRVAQTIPLSFGGKDPYETCPFYMASFFLGLKMGDTIPGIIPLDTMHHDAKAVLARDVDGAGAERLAMQPMFGAPVATLSAACVKALPINLGRAMGEATAKGFLAKVDARNRETYPPRASDATLGMLASRWGDLEPLPKAGRAGWSLSSAEAFDCADTLRAVGEYKRRLARDFNALQDKDPLSDGIKISAVQLHMMSVVTHLSVPLPARERWDLSCARNMRLALRALPFAGAQGGLSCPFCIL